MLVEHGQRKRIWLEERWELLVCVEAVMLQLAVREQRLEQSEQPGQQPDDPKQVEQGPMLAVAAVNFLSTRTPASEQVPKSWSRVMRQKSRLAEAATRETER